MPNLVKVGKTKRKPSERAQELSGVSGVPSPFIVVFEQPVPNCNEIEKLVHAALERKGYRLSDSREFFNAPVHEIILTIFSMLNPAIAGASSRYSSKVDASNVQAEGDTTSFPTCDTKREERPWQGLWEEAENLRMGWDAVNDCETLEDYEGAFALYRDAARLGCLDAYSRMGSMYEHGEGVPVDEAKAIEVYKEGVKAGNYVCYLSLALIYTSLRDRQSVSKCLRLYFLERKNNLSIDLEGRLNNNCMMAILVRRRLEEFKEHFAEDIMRTPHLRDSLVVWLNDQLKSDVLRSVAPRINKAIDWLRSL